MATVPTLAAIMPLSGVRVLSRAGLNHIRCHSSTVPGPRKIGAMSRCPLHLAVL